MQCMKEETTGRIQQENQQGETLKYNIKEETTRGFQQENQQGETLKLRFVNPLSSLFASCPLPPTFSPSFASWKRPTPSFASWNPPSFASWTPPQAALRGPPQASLRDPFSKVSLRRSKRAPGEVKCVSQSRSRKVILGESSGSLLEAWGGALEVLGTQVPDASKNVKKSFLGPPWDLSGD